MNLANLIAQEEDSPVKRPVVHKARPDADPHFQFVDDGTPEAQRKSAAVSKGRKHNKGLGLYQDHVTHTTSDDEDGAYKGESKRPLNDVTTHVKNENRKKDFGSQWEMMDDSPGPNNGSFNNGAKKGITENQKKVLKTMDAQWGLYEESPENRGINISGNGMGGRKGTEFSLYDESPAQEKKENLGRKQGGNGMGGRKGTGFDWDF